MSISCQRRAAFGSAAPGIASINLRAETERSVFPMLSGSGMGDGKTLSIPSPSCTCVVGSAAVAPISSALDLEALQSADDA